MRSVWCTNLLTMVPRSKICNNSPYFHRKDGTLTPQDSCVNSRFAFLCIFNDVIKFESKPFCAFWLFIQWILDLSNDLNNLHKAVFWSTQIGIPVGYPICVPSVYDWSSCLFSQSFKIISNEITWII